MSVSAHLKGLIFLAVVLLLAVVFILDPGNFNLPSSVVQRLASNQIKESDLPISIDLLKNPMVYEWRGDIEGTLIAKDETSLTLSNKGSTLKIPILYPPATKPMTLFFNAAAIKPDTKNPGVPLSEVPVGSFLQGDFFVVNKNQIVGGSFTFGRAQSKVTPNPSQ